MSNIHWDYAETFTGKEAAYLIAGFNPSSNSAEDFYNAQPIIKRMKAAYYGACSDFRADFDHVSENDKLMFSRRTKSVGNLLSMELQKLVWHYENSDYVLSGKSFLQELIFDDPEDPHNVRHDAIMPLIRWENSDDHEFGDQVFDRYELGRWLRENNHRTMYQFLPPPPKAELPEKPLGTVERNNLLRIIVGMAIDAYGYVPGALTSPTPKEIETILDIHGVKVSDDTVRKYLKEAVGTVLPKPKPG